MYTDTFLTTNLLERLLECVNSEYSLSLGTSSICHLELGMTNITIVTRDDKFNIKWDTLFNNSK